MNKPAFILMDIEGTTTPKTFVYDTLFPYFLSHLGKVEDHQNELEYCNALKEVKETLLEEGKEELNIEIVIDSLRNWVENDRKHPALKKLQGLIWENGYRKGTLKGEVYEDVPLSLKKWSAAGIKLGIYSSGSVQAQKLLFGFSNNGNLCTYFDAFFDTEVGNKRETQSYKNILEKLEIEGKDMLFLSDTPEELIAAQALGIEVIQLVREDTEPSIDHDCINSFEEITFYE